MLHIRPRVEHRVVVCGFAYVLLNLKLANQLESRVRRGMWLRQAGRLILAPVYIHQGTKPPTQITKEQTRINGILIPGT